jgi:arsenate reductase
MAAGYLAHLAGDAIEVRSAGSAPADSVNPMVIEAMREEGIDLTNQKPKILTTDAVQASDVVRYHHGLRRRLPLVPRQALPRLATR